MSTQWHPANPEKLAKQFSSLGWLGFWIQLALISIPIILLIYLLFLSAPDSAQQRGIDLGNYLSIGSLVVMVFTTLWFYRYTRVAKRIPDPETRPPQASVMKTLWIGTWAASIGVFFSMLLLINAVGRLLFVLLATPQTGIPVAAPVGGGDPSGTLAAIDAISLMSLLVILTAELVVLAISLWLLFRVSRPSSENVEITPQDQETPA